ncbi:polyprenol phosphomannose-dependent alpha 1,6 mannosyltransferase MptB [Nakamurella sp.]|uniref:polyprenol phosphomannose-dependent alpha 1,6 mannosyltransferase MptB n=1 Tax=Nakamurella sp. TaxID=1869182 RepID=UPI003B3A93C2
MVRPRSEVAAAGGTGPAGERAVDRTAAPGVDRADGPTGPRAGGPTRRDPGPTEARPLDEHERGQLSRLRRWGTVGALLLMLGAGSSYGSASPIPNPVDGIRIIGLLSRIGPAALACSYTGIGLIVLCWVLIGRLAAPGRPRRLSRSQLSHTLAMWAVPLLVTPPLFSRDVYSYLAIGSMMANGFNPYEAGPYDTLGDADPYAHQVDVRWQHTASPYGPVYLLIARAVVTLAHDNLIVAVLLQRLIELVGVALIVWALPRLARICGFDPVAALWLGALNPLVLFHLIGGGHNEALMLGAMLAGIVIAWQRTVIGGVVLISLGMGIKATAGMTLAFLVIMLALRAGGRWRDLLRIGVLVGAVAVATFATFTVIAGVGFGWVAALGAPGTVRSFLSVSTSLGVIAGQSGLLLGLGDHTQAVLDVMQPVGTLIGSAIAVVLMWQCWQRRINPIAGLGMAMGAFVLFAPVIQPWYLLWAALPLAASTADPRVRTATIWLTVLFSVTIMPNGATIPVFVIVQAVVVAAVVVGGVFYGLRRAGLPSAHPDPVAVG